MPIDIKLSIIWHYVHDRIPPQTWKTLFCFLDLNCKSEEISVLIYGNKGQNTAQM